MSNYKVSVIVPIYNIEQYIRRALDSLANQTLKELEVILVDDGSTDNSGSIADEYAEKFANFSVIHKMNGGSSDARNIGIEVSSAQYIGFIDPDDYAEFNMFEQLYSSVVKNESDIAICSYIEEYSENNFQNRTVSFSFENNDVNSLICEFINGRFGAYAWNKLYKTSIIKDESIEFPKGIQLGEDTVFLCEYLKHIDAFSVVDLYLYHYIRNSNSICAKYHKRQFEYYRGAYLAKKSLISATLSDTEYWYSVNDKKYLQNCLVILDQINSLGNKAGLKERREATFLAIEDEKFKELLSRYGNSLENKDEIKKRDFIINNNLNGLMLYEIWKMRILARIKYYLS